MIEAERWLPRAQRRRFRRPRLRRERIGELVQVDGSEHRWFEDRGPPCALLVFVDDATSLVFADDATSRILRARFVASETTFACFGALEGCLKAHGRPVALAVVLGPRMDGPLARALFGTDMSVGRGHVYGVSFAAWCCRAP